MDVFGLAAHLGVKLVKYSELNGFEKAKLTNENAVLSDGFLTVVEEEGNRIPYIFYNDSRDRRRIRFTILHEIGHFVFGHCRRSDLAEAMANFFCQIYDCAAPVDFDVLGGRLCRVGANFRYFPGVCPIFISLLSAMVETGRREKDF